MKNNLPTNKASFNAKEIFINQFYKNDSLKAVTQPLSLITDKSIIYFKEENKSINSTLKTIKSNKETDIINTPNLDPIFLYLKTLVPYAPLTRKRGISIKYTENISYFFNKKSIKSYENLKKIQTNNPINITSIQNTNNLLISFFKSIYCIISKPVFLITSDKIIIQLFYYLQIPKYRIFKWFSIFYYNKIKNLYIAINNKIKNKYAKSIYLKFLKKNLNINNRFLKKQRIIKPILNLKNKYIKIRNNFIINNSKNYLNKLNIFRLFKNNLNKVYQNKFNILCNILSKKYNRPVELHLTRLHKYYEDSNILVNLLAMNFKNKNKSSRVLIKKIYNRKPVKNLNYKPNLINNNKIKFINTLIGASAPINNLIPDAFISGLNIRIAGRLMREPIIPRITTKTIEKGASAPGKINFLDTSSITRKNKKGAFTIKIVSGQNFIV